MGSVAFHFFGNLIHFPDNEIYYAKIYKKYSDKAWEVVKLYEKNYKDFGSLASLIKKGNDTAQKYVEETLNMMISELKQNKVYDVSLNRVLEKHYYDIFYDWEEAYDSVCEAYEAIMDNKEEAVRQRQKRKESRGRWVGGGFGLGGAIKGAMTAGALNMAGGAVHGVFNTLGNIADSFAASSAASKIYRNEDTLNTLLSGLYRSILTIHLVHCEYLNIEIPAYDMERAEIILSNIPTMPQSDKIPQIIECIRTCPIFEDIYFRAVDELGDEKGEIADIAEKFGLWSEVIKYKSELAVASIDTDKLAAMESENSTHLMLVAELKENQEIQDFNNDKWIRYVDAALESARDMRLKTETEMKKLGLTPETLDNAKWNKLNKWIKKVDVGSRTVKRIVYDTREQAQTARKEYNYITNDLKIYEILKLEGRSLEDIEKLKAIQREVENKCQTEAVVAEVKELIDRQLQIFEDLNIADKQVNSELITEEKLINIKEILMEKYGMLPVLENYYKKINEKIVKIRYGMIKIGNYSCEINKFLADIEAERPDILCTGEEMRKNRKYYNYETKKVVNKILTDVEAETSNNLFTEGEIKKLKKYMGVFDMLERKAKLYTENKNRKPNHILVTAVMGIVFGIIAWKLKNSSSPLLAIIAALAAFSACSSIILIIKIIIGTDELDGNNQYKYTFNECKEAYEILNAGTSERNMI